MHQVGLAILPDRAHADCHDEIAAAMFGDALSAGVRGRTEPRDLFAAVIPATVLQGARGDLSQHLQVVPDAALHVRMRAARTARADARQRHRGTAAQRGPLRPAVELTAWDLKTVHAGGADYWSARARDDGQCGAVAERARRVQADYERHAASVDARTDVQRFNSGRQDAVMGALRALGPVRAAVWGNYGEASDDVHQLLDICADLASRARWRQLGARSVGEARGYFVQQLRRSWGLTAVRAFARHRLRRVQFVGAERRARAVQARGAAEGEWAHGDSGRFQAWSARASGAQAGQSAARWWPGGA